MDPYALSPSPDNADAKAAFRKLSNDAASRKYRRRSPVSGSSSSYGSPKREYSSSPIHSRGDLARDSDPRRKKDDGKGVDRDSGRNHHDRSGHSYRHSDRQSSRSSHNYHRRDEYVRHEKYTDEEERNYKSSRRGSVDTRSDRTRRESEHYRSRDHLQGDDKYSRDRSDGSGSRSRDKERETSSVEYQKYKDKDSLSYRAGSGRRNTNSNVEGMKSGEWDRHMGDGDGRDEKRDYRRSSGDYKSDRSPVYEESRSHRKEIAKSDPRELDGQLDGQKYTKEEKKKYDARETSRHKDQYDREPGELFEDKTSGSQESAAKKTKFSSGTDFVSKFTTVADERQSSSSKQAPELVGKLTSEQAPVKGSEAANDIDAAKVAAMKAAELVNKNLIGTGYMSTDQKKKLLWGNKKNTAAEESGHHWDSALFSDRERQEKFNKLMSLRLPWYLWPIVGCEGRRESGAKTRQSRKQQPPPSREAEGTAAGFGEAIHCWTPSKRWPNCWTRSLSLYSGDLSSCTTPFSSIVWYFLARILSFVIVDSWLARGNCALPFLFEILDHDGKRCCMVYYAINLYICVCVSHLW